MSCSHRRPISHTNLYGGMCRKERHTSFQCNSLEICRCVLELYVLYHFRVNIAKLAYGGSQCTHLKKIAADVPLHTNFCGEILPSKYAYATRNVMERPWAQNSTIKQRNALNNGLLAIIYHGLNSSILILIYMWNNVSMPTNHAASQIRYGGLQFLASA